MEPKRPASTILISVANTGREKQLVDVVGSEYDVRMDASANGKIEETSGVDLLMLDLGRLREIGARGIEAYQSEASAPAPPILLLARESRLTHLDSSVWDQVDDVIGVPVRSHELKGRVRALLRLHRYAAEADRARSKYQALFESNAHGILVLQGRRVVEANRRAGNLFGCEADALLGRTVSSLSTAKQDSGRSSSDYAGDLLQTARSEGEARTEWRFEPDGGEPFWADFTLRSVTIGGDEYVQALFHDITPRRRAREKLELQAQMLDEVGQAVIATDAEGCITFWNEASENVYGWARDEVLGRNVLDLTVPDGADGIAAEIMASISEGEAWIGEFDVQRKDGSTFPAIVSDTPFFDENGELVGVIGVTTDISDQRAVEGELRESRARLADAQRIAELGSWFRDFESDELEWSDETRRIFGWDADETVTYDIFMEAVHPDDRETLRAAQEEAMEDGDSIDVEYRIVRPSGEQRIVRERGEVERAPDGTVLSMSGTVLDVTAQKEREQRIEWLRRKYQGLLEGAPDPFFVLDPESGNVVEANEAAATLLGTTVDELEGRHYLELTPADDEDRYRALWDRWMEEMGPDQELVSRLPGGGQIEIVTDDGTHVPVEISSTVMDLGGEDLVVASVRDITDRRERERKLRRLSEAVDQAQEAVLIVRAVGEYEAFEIVYANTAFEELTGYDTEAIRGASPEMFRGPKTDPEVVAAQAEAVKAGEPWEGEMVNYRKDGTTYRVESNLAPVQDPDGQIEYWVSVERDVTEEREREEALRQQRNLLTQTQRLAGAWEADVRTEEVAWSEEMYRIHEVPEGTDVDVDRAFSFFDAEHEAKITEAHERCVEEGRAYDLEGRLTTAKGNRRWVRMVGAPAHWDDGEVIKVAGAMQEITGRKQAEQAVREREARLRGLVNSIPGVAYQIAVQPDGSYETRFVSDHAEEVLGLSSSLEGFYDAFVECVAESHREGLFESIEEAVETESAWSFEIPFQKPSGEWIWLLGISTPDSRNDEIIFNGVLLDITDRKEGEERWRALLESHPGGVLISADGEYLYANAAAARTLGADDPADVVGLDVEELVLSPDKEVIAERKAQLARGERTEPWEHEIMGLDGKRRTVLAHSVPIQYEGQKAAQTVLQDMTAQKEREEELRAAKEEAEEAARLKSAMLANMSHEVRTPLTSIIGFADLLIENLEGDNKSFAEKIHGGSRRLLTTLESMLELSTLEAGVYDLEREPVDLVEMVEETLDLFKPKAAQKGLTVDVSADEERIEALANREALTRVLENLLENARKFTPEGGSIRVRVRTDADGSTLEVEDTGVGMDPEAVPAMFEAFQQESQGISREYEGTGLGLSIVKALVEAHGGTIDVETAKGEGTTFSISIPYAPEAEE